MEQAKIIEGALMIEIRDMERPIAMAKSIKFLRGQVPPGATSELQPMDTGLRG